MLKNLNGIIISCIICFSIIISALIITTSLKSIKQAKTISVTGSAQKELTADYGTWSGSFEVVNISKKDAYNKLKNDEKEVLKFFENLGANEKDVEFSSIRSYPVYVKNYNGYNTNEIESYRLSQSVSIKSKDVNLIDSISKKSTDLISFGIDFSSNDPEYFCTDLDSIKIEMIGKATENCKKRATQIVENTNAKLGNIISSKTGVFQITPLNSTEISDYGMNDTSSIHKQITAVVKCEFGIK